jgi:uncharacterized protein (TIGR02466 family)
MSQTDKWDQFDYFPSSIYMLDKSEFLESVTDISNKYLKKVKEDSNEIYPVKMTDNFMNEESIQDFSMYVLNTGWNILKSQGYAMDNFTTHLSEMWTQEHGKISSIEQHVHGFGSQLSVFYFLDCPKDCSRVVFHDPRPGKVMSSLPEENMINATPASLMVNFEPKPGMLLFANSYIPHSFTRNGSDDPIRFVHMNIYVNNKQTSCMAPAEVI